MAQKVYDVVASVGEYTDRATGQKKKRWRNCGTIFKNDQGQFSMKLDCVPVGPEWSGFFSLFEPGQKPGQQNQGGYQSVTGHPPPPGPEVSGPPLAEPSGPPPTAPPPAPPPAGPAAQADDNFEDDIPF